MQRTFTVHLTSSHAHAGSASGCLWDKLIGISGQPNSLSFIISSLPNSKRSTPCACMIKLKLFQFITSTQRAQTILDDGNCRAAAAFLCLSHSTRMLTHHRAYFQVSLTSSCLRVCGKITRSRLCNFLSMVVQKKNSALLSRLREMLCGANKSCCNFG